MFICYVLLSFSMVLLCFAVFSLAFAIFCNVLDPGCLPVAKTSLLDPKQASSLTGRLQTKDPPGSWCPLHVPSIFLFCTLSVHSSDWFSTCPLKIFHAQHLIVVIWFGVNSKMFTSKFQFSHGQISTILA